MGWEERGVYYPLLLKDLEKYTLSITSYYTRYTCIVTTIFKLPTSLFQKNFKLFFSLLKWKWFFKWIFLKPRMDIKTVKTKVQTIYFLDNNVVLPFYYGFLFWPLFIKDFFPLKVPHSLKYMTLFNTNFAKRIQRPHTWDFEFHPNFF